AELVGRTGRIEDAPLELAEPRIDVDWLERRPGHTPAEIEELEHRRLLARTDVEDASLLAERGQRGARNIADVHVVARLASVSEDPRSLVARERSEEDRH